MRAHATPASATDVRPYICQRRHFSPRNSGLAVCRLHLGVLQRSPTLACHLTWAELQCASCEPMSCDTRPDGKKICHFNIAGALSLKAKAHRHRGALSLNMNLIRLTPHHAEGTPPKQRPEVGLRPAATMLRPQARRQPSPSAAPPGGQPCSGPPAAP